MDETESTLLCRQVGQELMVHDRASGRLAFLNATAAEVWRLADATGEVEPVVQAICRRYDGAKPDAVREHVAACMRRLAELQLLGRAPNGALGRSFDEV